MIINYEPKKLNQMNHCDETKMYFIFPSFIQSGCANYIYVEIDIKDTRW